MHYFTVYHLLSSQYIMHYPIIPCVPHLLMSFVTPCNDISPVLLCFIVHTHRLMTVERELDALNYSTLSVLSEAFNKETKQRSFLINHQIQLVVRR